MTSRKSNALGRCSRRTFLRRAGGAAAGCWLVHRAQRRVWAGSMSTSLARTARLRPDLLDKDSLRDLEVIQLTSEADVPSSHLYMEAQIFTMDSQRFVLHRSATAHGGSRSDPKHQYLLCDIDDGCSLHPLTEETGATAASVTPGRPARILLRRRDESGRRPADAETCATRRHRTRDDSGDRYAAAGHELPPQPALSSVDDLVRRETARDLRVSGRRQSGRGTLRPDGLRPRAASVRLVFQGPTWCNMHPQYCRSTESGRVTRHSHPGEPRQ